MQNAAARPAHSTDALVIDDNINQIEYKLAKCCNPIKGDDIFGFVTISSGITIHRTDCPNARRMRENYPYRVIDARWRQTAGGAFRVTIRIVKSHRPFLKGAGLYGRPVNPDSRRFIFSHASGRG